MRPVYKPLASALGALIIAATGLIAVSDRVLPFTETLQREHPVGEERRPGSSSVSLQFANEDESVTLASEVRVYELQNNSYAVSVRTSHTEGVDTHLDSIRLKLNVAGESVPEVALRAPSGHPWEPIHFGQSDDGQGVTLDVPDLGFQGTGTVVLDFIVGPYHEGDVPKSIWLDYNARLHKEARVNLTSQEADALVEIPMPDDTR